jgi:hypothetical protein
LWIGGVVDTSIAFFPDTEQTVATGAYTFEFVAAELATGGVLGVRVAGVLARRGTRDTRTIVFTRL